MSESKSPKQLESLHGVEAKYQEQGYVIVPDVLDADLSHEMNCHFECLNSRFPGATGISLEREMLLDPFIYRVASDPRLLAIAERFIGPNIALFLATYFSKEGVNNLPLLWHQDGHYWPIDPKGGVISLWVALDHSTPENGCVRVIPGSQHLELKEVLREDRKASVLNSKIADSWVDESKAVDLILKPGDVSIHGPTMIHGSNANTSGKRRRGLALRYIPTTTHIVTPQKGAEHIVVGPERKWPTVLLSGAPVPGVNEYFPRPHYKPKSHMQFKGCERFI